MKVLVSLLAILAFLSTAIVLGAAVMFGLVAFVIGPHGVGILPEWANLPVLICAAAGVCFVAFKVRTIGLLFLALLVVAGTGFGYWIHQDRQARAFVATPIPIIYKDDKQQYIGATPL